jgi:hypothetical protein
VNVLDENISDEEMTRLREWRIAVRKIGPDLGTKGYSDSQIIALLHTLDRPTFFTLDEDYYQRRLCHRSYCLIHLDIPEAEVADYVRRLLKHSELNTKAKRMGLVVSASARGVKGWRQHPQTLIQFPWDHS